MGSALGNYWFCSCFARLWTEQQARSINLPKKNETSIFPVWTEQASSIKVLLLWLYCIGETHTLLRRKQCFDYASFAEIWPHFWSYNKERVSTSRKKNSFSISFQEHKSMKSVHEQSILVVCMAKFRLLREPFKMFLFTMDQLSLTMTIDYCLIAKVSCYST